MREIAGVARPPRTRDLALPAVSRGLSVRFLQEQTLPRHNGVAASFGTCSAFFLVLECFVAAVRCL